MAGIYHNAELGVISMSSDGTNWLTIADKNLGATQVYNNGDTLSEANSGKYYQWGNNHGFPGIGNSETITTSSSQVNAASYGVKLGYYESSTFIKGAYYWDTSNNANLWGGVTGGNEDKRGPCPEGFHVPTMAEANSLLSTMTSIGFPDGSDFNYYLKMPYAGVYAWDNAGYAGSNHAHYTTSTSVDNDSRYTLFMRGSPNQAQIGSIQKTSGCSIRPFKNISIAPDENWTTLYSKPSVPGAGIFWDSTNGLISISSDGTNWITIADKNLGATQVFNTGDTLSEANCGKLYQWGNNYGFPWNSSSSLTTSTTQVDASGYGPTVYYDSDTFITRSGNVYGWDSSNNDNLWGGVTGTNIAMQGPCPEGFHISSATEWTGLKTIMDGFNLTTRDNWNTYLYFPSAGARNTTYADIVGDGSECNYWSSSAADAGFAYLIAIYSNGPHTDYTVYRTWGLPIRPFANTPVIPDYTWERLYGDEIPAPKKYIKRFQNSGNYYYFGEPPVHASGVTLNKSSLTFTEAGQTEQLIATVAPSDAVDKTVTWTSSDTTVAKVYQDGTVECVNPGECTITCTTNDGGYTASCEVSNKISVDFLLIGGGGGGGLSTGYYQGGWCRFGGGGGGAGGVIIKNCEEVSKNINITIGQGGAGGCNGWNSIISNEDLCYCAIGGGTGMSIDENTRCGVPGCDGGSGGGGGGGCATTGDALGGTGLQGCNGGKGYSIGGGGGGGYGGVGGGEDINGGGGGGGLYTDFGGDFEYFAGGGGGGTSSTSRTVGGYGCNGGGNGGTNYSGCGGCNATTCGSGGGGGSFYGAGCGAGGLLIARYPTSCGYNLTGGCKYTCGDYTIHCFTSDGILCIN